jgi:DNA polymerase III epsilon subunit-like protein
MSFKRSFEPRLKLGFKRILLSGPELSTNGKRDELYEQLQPYADFLNVEKGLSTQKKGELVRIIDGLNRYRNMPERTFIFAADGGDGGGDRNDRTVVPDEQQMRIITAPPDQHMRVIAGAGSGKTTTILCRIRYLVDCVVSDPNRILVLTFNVDAAEDLQKRLRQLFGFPIAVQVRTIDSYCATLKWKYGERDSPNSAMSANSSMSELGIDGNEIMLRYGALIARQYSHVFFDEFQDVNSHQFNMLKIFAENGSKLTVIGDDSQNIYQWRGSNNYYIINMDRIMNSNLVTHTITTNYRSTSQITEMANSSIRHNRVRLDKAMVAATATDSVAAATAEIKLLVYDSEARQTHSIIERIGELVASGHRYDEFAILSRGTFYLKLTETILEKQHIPYVSLISDNTGNDDKKPVLKANHVTLTTIHRAKGLEWDIVFVIGLNDQFFPCQMNNNLTNIEEERRLFYVAITRPRRSLYFVSNNDELPVSRFVQEVDEHVSIVDFRTSSSSPSPSSPSPNPKQKPIFGTTNRNRTKDHYGVTDVVRLLQGDDIRQMRLMKLIPDLSKIVTTTLFEEKLTFNSRIREHSLESDFGEFCDRLITRNIVLAMTTTVTSTKAVTSTTAVTSTKTVTSTTAVTSTKTAGVTMGPNPDNIKLYDDDTESIVKGVELTEPEMTVFNKFGIAQLYHSIIIEQESMGGRAGATSTAGLLEAVMSRLRRTVTNPSELSTAHRICVKIGTRASTAANSLAVVASVRRIGTYPSEFIKRLRSSYERYCSPTESHEILHDVYMISLCRKFQSARRRLIYRDVFDIFVTDFGPIGSRVWEYVEKLRLQAAKEVVCKVCVSKLLAVDQMGIFLSGEIDMIDVSSDTIVDFKCSDSDQFKVEWVVQLLLYLALLRRRSPAAPTVANSTVANSTVANPTKIAVFNVFSGKYYELDVASYNTDALLEYVVDLIRRDISGGRGGGRGIGRGGDGENDGMELKLLQEYGKAVPTVGTTDGENYTTVEEDPYGFRHLCETEQSSEQSSAEPRSAEPRSELRSEPELIMCVDVETGSFHPRVDIIQVGYVVYDTVGNILKRVSHLVRDRLVENAAFDIHRISSEMLAKSGIEFEQVMFEFLTDLSRCRFILGHNVATDISKFKKNIASYRIPIEYDPFDSFVRDGRVRDTMRMSRERFGATPSLGHTLSDLHQRLFGTAHRAAHDASEDALATGRCYFAMLNSDSLAISAIST